MFWALAQPLLWLASFRHVLCVGAQGCEVKQVPFCGLPALGMFSVQAPGCEVKQVPFYGLPALGTFSVQGPRL